MAAAARWTRARALARCTTSSATGLRSLPNGSRRRADFFAYDVISLSHADLERVREKLRVTFRELRSLVAASEPEEVAALVNPQGVTLSRAGSCERES